MSQLNNGHPSNSDKSHARVSRTHKSAEPRIKIRERIQRQPTQRENEQETPLSRLGQTPELFRQHDQITSPNSLPVADHRTLQPVTAFSQPKLVLNAPDDAYEIEAEKLADAVMRMPSGKLTGRKRIVPSIPRSMTKGSSTSVADKTEANIQRMQGGGRPLDEKTRIFFEQRMGADFGHVRIHTDANAIQTSRDIQARAFTVGNHIAFNSGQYDPSSQAGKHLLAHELAHTLQQASSSSIHGKRIQRAMKYEYQIKSNKLLLDDGQSIIPLPRKFGPQDFLVKKTSGARLESETHGQPEFETGWERDWTKLSAQIRDAAKMATDMMGAPPITKDGQTFKKFPFAGEISHLFRGSRFETRRPKGKGIWKSRQATGEYRVNKDRVPVKEASRSRSNTVSNLRKGTKVTVTDSKKGWRYIIKGDTEGWVKRRYLSKEYKRYESNKTEDSAGNEVYIDKPLKSGAQLLIDDSGNPSWKAYIQTSESFELGQFSSFFKESTHVFEGKPWKTETEDTAQNLVQPDSSSELQSFVLLIVNYIKMARGEGPYGHVGRNKSAKYAFPVMSRTDLGSLYKSMSRPDREEFARLVADKDDGLLAKMGLDGKEKLFEQRYPRGKKKRKKKGHRQRYEPLTVTNWLKKIMGGEDLLRGRGFPAAMGRFRIEEEKGKHKGLMRAENRKGNKSLAPDMWERYALVQFAGAKYFRPRDSGKGKTGLKW